MNNGNGGGLRHFGPDFSGPKRTLPHGPSPLARHRDEAEIANRCTIRLGIAIDDEDPLASTSPGQGTCQPDDSAAYDSEVET
jgi:hypothetical protein